jgi:endonuclease/exonuclease/phosphatase family metal-dependent hydrolase
MTSRRTARPLQACRHLMLGALTLLGCRTGRNYDDPLGPRYGSAAGDPAPLPGAARDTLRVVSFNIEFSRNVDGAIALLRDSAALAADVVLLQEMTDDGTRRVASALGMGYVYYPAIHHGRAGQDFGNAVLSRWPIVDDAKLQLPNRSRYAGTQRIATAATIRVGDDSLRLYSMHLGTVFDIGARARREQFEAILADAARFPLAIVGGDMNSASLGGVARLAGYAWPTVTLPKSSRFGRLDHLFVRGLRLPPDDTAGVVRAPRAVSDHSPVWVRVALP